MNGILCIGDVHLCDKPPSGATEAYLTEQWAVLTEALEIAATGNLLPVFAGDIFHRKTPSRNSHALNEKLIRICKDSPLQPRVVPGNHDMLHDRFDSLSSQPLGVVVASGAMKVLQGMDADNHHLWGVAWGQRPPVFPVGDSLVVAHAEIYPDGKVPPWGGDPASAWAHAIGKGYCYYGHIHDYHGIYKSGDMIFANMGALTRGALTESERTRVPAVCKWDPVNGFVRIELESPLPAEEVLRIVESEEVKKQRADAEDFLSQLNVSAHTSLEEAIDEIMKLEDVEEYVRALALDLIEKMSV